MNTQPLQEKRYPLTNDLLFKAVFGREEEQSKYFLKSLLNALLHLEGNKQIKTLTHKNPFSIVDSYTEKEIIFDIKVEIDNGDQVDIEMQVQANNAYRKRSLYYWAKLHSEQSLKGQDYEQVVKSICINIVDAKCLRESKKAHNFFQVIDCNEHFLRNYSAMQHKKYKTRYKRAYIASYIFYVIRRLAETTVA